jgi:hypothetical protein
MRREGKNPLPTTPVGSIGRKGAFMKPGDVLKTTMPIRSQKTGMILPREGKFVATVENLGRTLILVNFGNTGDEYLFPNEVAAATTH